MIKKPEPWVGVSSIGEYAVEIFVRAYVKSYDYWQALPSIQKDVKQALDKAGILYAVTRQATIIRNEPLSLANAPPFEKDSGEIDSVKNNSSP